MFIHVIFFTCLSKFRGLLEPFLAVEGREAPWTGRQPTAGLTQRQATTHTDTHDQFGMINPPSKHVF